MLIVLSAALAAAYTSPQPPQHLQTIPNFISTKGPSVGLNFRWLAQLAHVSTVVQAFQRENDPQRKTFAGH